MAIQQIQSMTGCINLQHRAKQEERHTCTRSTFSQQSDTDSISQRGKIGRQFTNLITVDPRDSDTRSAKPITLYSYNSYCASYVRSRGSSSFQQDSAGKYRALEPINFLVYNLGWWRSTVVERRSLAGELSLSCVRPAADG